MIKGQEQLVNFVNNTEFAGAELHPLAGDASARRYVRAILGERQAMVMDTPAKGENFPAFVEISEYLHKNGYSAPEILARDMEKGFLLLEDLGSDSFTRVLEQQIGDIENRIYSAAIDLLAQWHNPANQNLPSLPLYDEDLYLREVALFPDWFLPQIMGAEKAAVLRVEYMDIWREILRSFPLAQNIFVHRDFHADNLMWLPQREGIKRVGLLDFQDAVMGDAAYDMMSLLEDARRDVSGELADDMIARYLQKTGVDEKNFRNAYDILGAQRNSKIIGIFVRLAVRDGKDGYLRFLPRVWAHLQRDMSNPLLKNLREWLDANVPLEAQGDVSEQMLNLR